MGDLGRRIQGTDGIRGEVRVSNAPIVKGLSPLEAFVAKGIITEKFIELYVYSYVKGLIDRGRMAPGADVVVGWDPRDKEGIYTEAAISGISKGGGRPLVVGIVPTPLIPVYTIYKLAACGIMITASHNPPDQNGIKIFIGETGLKLFPADDIVLTEMLVKNESLNLDDLKGLDGVDMSGEAIEVFSRFSLAPENSWFSEDAAPKDTILVVDPANGSYSLLAAEMFTALGYTTVEVSADLTGEVNRDSGVVETEGLKTISPEMVHPGGRFEKNKAIKKIFEIGAGEREALILGGKRLSGAIFDGDGDRFIRLDYNPFSNHISVMSGDEIAFLQAAYLASDNKGMMTYVNTVESDLEVATAALKLGYETVITGVGDKWILLEALLSLMQAGGVEKARIDEIRRGEGISGEEISDIIRGIDVPPESIKYGVGAEESGHIITYASIVREDGVRRPIFCGNGFKSALNSFVSTDSLLAEYGPEAYYRRLEAPFEPGFKNTLYVYYTDKSKISGETEYKAILEEKGRGILSQLFPGCSIERVDRVEEPDMLYLNIVKGGEVRGVLYVRNSGTESKTGVNLRGSKSDAADLVKAGEEMLKEVLGGMKMKGDRYAEEELLILKEVSKSPGRIADIAGRVKGLSGDRLIKEMIKGGIIISVEGRLSITPLGSWYLENQN